jgi:hypothetical protein
MTTPRYSDEYIEHWGRAFVAEDLYHRRGIRFDTFLLAPGEILKAVRALPADAAPLLPRQAQVMHRELVCVVTSPRPVATAEAAEAIEHQLVPARAELRGDAYIERLRHHAYTVASASHRNRRAHG